MAPDHDRPFRPVVWGDEREHVRVLSTVTARQVDAANEERGRKRIRACRVRGHDAGGDDAIRRPAGPGIDDVTVAMTTGDDELLSRTARAERSVAQPLDGGS